MFKKNILIIILVFVSSTTLASPNESNENSSTSTTTQKAATSAIDYNQVIDAYKAYLLSINPQLRQEIVTYRKEIANLNKKKRQLYQGLTQEGQNFLAKEQEFRKKLPLRERGKINIQNPGEKVNYNAVDNQQEQAPQ